MVEKYFNTFENFSTIGGEFILPHGYHFELAYEGSLLSVELRRKIFGNLSRLVDYAVICNGGDTALLMRRAFESLVVDNF